MFISPKNAESQINESFSKPLVLKKELLVLHSYYKGFEWTDLIDKGINEAFQGQTNEVSIYTEYMDLKRFPENSHIDSLRQIYRIKYARTHFDAILCSDDHAFQFLLQFGDDLFPHTPIIFCGVNDFDASMLKEHPDVTGVMETLDIRRTLDIALNLHRDTKRIAIIVDTTPTGVGTLREVQNVVSVYAPKIQFDVYDNIKISDLLQIVGNFSRGTIVLLLNFNRDSAGNNFSHGEIIKLLNEASSVPIYSVWDFFTGQGIIGGVITSGIEQGRKAGHQALRILRGEKAANLAIEKELPGTIIFDYLQMRRFSVQKNDLPEESVVVNLPGTFYRINKKLIWGLGGLLFFLLAATIILVLSVLQRKKAQKALSEAKLELLLSNEKLSMILDSLPIIPFTCDPSNQRITYVSPVIERITGYPPAAFSEDHNFWIERIHDSDRDRLKSISFQFDAEGRQHFKYRFLCFDKTYRWFYDLRHAVHRTEQGIPMIVGIWQDVTKEEILREESDRRMQQLIQADKLASLGEVVAGIAHEINNPNSFISYNIPLLQESWNFFDSVIKDYSLQHPHWQLNGMSGEELHREMDDILKDIAASSQRINHVISDLKDFARIDTENVGQQIEINEVVKKALNIVGAQIRKSFVEYTVHLAPNLPLIQGHFTKLEQVVTNLVVNATQSIMEGKRSVFIIRTEFVEHHNCVVVHVQDTGAGIPQNIGLRIFDPFFTTRSRQGGTGLGLSVSRCLVEEHRGALMYVSRLDTGTRFSLYLPLAKDARISIRPTLLWVGADYDLHCILAQEFSPPQKYHKILATGTLSEAWEIIACHPELVAVVVNFTTFTNTAFDFFSELTEHDPLLKKVAYGTHVGSRGIHVHKIGLVDLWLPFPLSVTDVDSFLRIHTADEASNNR